MAFAHNRFTHINHYILSIVTADDNIITIEQLAELKYRAHVANIDFVYR